MNSIFNKYIFMDSKNYNESNVTVSTLYKHKSEFFEKKTNIDILRLIITIITFNIS